MTSIHQKQILAWSIATSLGALAMAPALAQDAPASAGSATTKASDKKPATTLSTIVVHAQKRVEYLQDVPITVSVLDAQQLHAAGVHDIKDLQMLVPALQVNSDDNSANTTARIRGIGTIGDNAGLESTVGITIDGVPRARNGVAFGDLGVLNDIEVLQGPQGTVFGKNTAAGVINITTQEPTFSQQGHIDLSAGNYRARGFDAYYSNAISENVAFSLYAVDRKHVGYNDVFVGNGPRTLNKDADQNFHSFRGQLLINPSSDVSIRLIGDYTKHNENCCGSVAVINGPVAPLIDAFAGGQGAIPVADPSRRLEYTNDSTQERIVDEGLSAQVDWTTPWLNNAVLTSITSVRKYGLQAASDLDFSAADLATHNFGPQNGERFNTWTQEFHMAGSTDHVDWLGGLYFDNVRAQRTEEIIEQPQYEGFVSALTLEGLAAALPPGLINTANPQNFFSEITGLPYGQSYTGVAQQDMWNQGSKSSAAFGNATWHVTDQLALTGGARFTHESKDTNFFYSNPNGGIGCGAAITTNGIANALAARGAPASVIPLLAPSVIGTMCLPWQNPLFNGLSSHNSFTENEWSGTLKAAYRWNDHVLTYLSGARGYTAGGYNLARVQSGTGHVDGGSGIFPVTNTVFPGEFVNSFELGAKTTWDEGNLLLDGSLFHSKFTNYQLNLFSGISWAVDSIPELTTQGADVNLLWQTPVPGLMVQAATTYTKARFGHQTLTDPTLVGLPGSVASFAPKWSDTAGVAYQWNFNDSLLGRFNINAKYNSSYNASGLTGLQYIQSGYALLDARLTIGAIDKRWSVELYGKNLTNRTYAQSLYQPALQTGSVNAFLGAPRTFGLNLRLAL